MTLTNDIIRDTLLCIEKLHINSTEADGRFHRKEISWNIVFENNDLNALYDIDDIKYCILMLGDAGLIKITPMGRKDKPSMVDIDGLTWEGHQLLNSIRDDDIWAATKAKLGNFSKMSISVIAKLATEICLEYGKIKLGLS